ncbi:YggS family pyridoxal phosphate-dependent enzyme [Flavobacterium sp. J372]|uniref:YggS family pyridoxal phosphate-dependent enzyme n=1 Tax=Flavobacterium sp. J372 TaxID=2898436 RepID=UPI00215181FE|nr:YggS family pyridoxal phosphate-dependent enzyme [Flavobacterium sp. J372]MCR5862213.1 YggS family pyridoxal phosphate-dependent enzyme [Flavobacterium sp. J372]
MSIQNNLLEIKASLPSNVTLVAVSKTWPVDDLMEAYNAGQRFFGENKVQEMTQKWEQMPKDTEWHMIGHLQTNKVKYIAPYVSLIHSVDSLKLLTEINRQGQRYRKIINCLLQVHIAEEDTKFGLDENELYALLASEEFNAMENINVTGLMGMATFTEDMQQVKREFMHLKSIFEEVRQQPQTLNLKPKTLSMGMSGDYRLAIECGSTMVRIGSSIFGTR